jgi:hypothetical protein
LFCFLPYLFFSPAQWCKMDCCLLLTFQSGSISESLK